MPLTAFLAVKGPLIIQDTIDNGIQKQDLDYVINQSFLYLTVLFVLALVQATQNIILQSAGIRTLKDLRETIVHHISHFGKKDYDEKPLGVHLSRATSDVETIGEMFLQGITYILSDSLIIVGVYISIFSNNAILGLITLVLVPIIIFTINWFSVKLRKLYDNIRTLNGKLSAQLNEAFSMLYEINIFNLRHSFVKDFEENNHSYRDQSVKAISLDALIYSLLDGMLYITIGAVLIILCMFPSLIQVISIGFIIAYIQLLQKLFDPIKEMGSRFAVLQSALAALNKISSSLSTPLPSDAGTKEIEDHNINIENISFSYIKNEPVLNNLTLNIPLSHSLAIVGPTGSGKSTLIKLLTRQYDVDKGDIKFGKTSIKDISRTSIKENIVLVPQDPAIFHNTIKFNITLDRPGVSEETMISICKKIDAHGFISSMPDGYNSVLEESGGNLSTGQRQLIALARALASPAEILIFDEATANIDTTTELQIQKAMDFAMSTKTSIIIAHRLSTIKNVEQIIVLQNGVIIDQGKHKELLTRPGLYKSMYELQSSNNED